MSVSAPAYATYNNDTQKQAIACGENTVQIPDVENGRSGAEGSTVELTELTVPAELQGKVVSVSAEFTNNTSVHPGNDISINSNSSSLVLEGVEDSANKVTTKVGRLTLGNTVAVSLTFGEDEIASVSGELKLNVDCNPPTGGQGGGVVQSVTTTAPQVVAPVGSVDTGEGTSSVNKGALAGLAASLSAAGFGCLRLRRSRSM